MGSFDEKHILSVSRGEARRFGLGICVAFVISIELEHEGRAGCGGQGCKWLILWERLFAEIGDPISGSVWSELDRAFSGG